MTKIDRAKQLMENAALRLAKLPVAYPFDSDIHPTPEELAARKEAREMAEMEYEMYRDLLFVYRSGRSLSEVYTEVR